MLNHIVLMGRLTRDPELRRTGSGIAVASFSLAVDRDFGSSANNGEKETDFIDIVAWRNTAEFVSKYFTKGRMAVVSGRLRSATGPIKRATSAAAQRSWQTMSTSATPSAMPQATTAGIPPRRPMATAHRLRLLRAAPTATPHPLPPRRLPTSR